MNQDTTANLYDFPAREYGIQGRWPSPDLAGFASANPADPQTWNRYAYVRNSPLMMTDPTDMGQLGPTPPPVLSNPPCDAKSPLGSICGLGGDPIQPVTPWCNPYFIVGCGQNWSKQTTGLPGNCNINPPSPACTGGRPIPSNQIVEVYGYQYGDEYEDGPNVNTTYIIDPYTTVSNPIDAMGMILVNLKSCLEPVISQAQELANSQNQINSSILAQEASTCGAGW